MPTVPMYSRPACADGWHQVTAPGGYEWWRFEAEDPATDTQLVAVLGQGCPLHAGYLRRYAAYRRRPTRVAPPLPADFPWVSFAVYVKGAMAARFTAEYPAGAFSAATDRLAVAVGPNAATAGADGAIRLDLHGPRIGLDGAVGANLTFHPVGPAPPEERRFLPRDVSRADHFWLPAAMRCAVEGSIELPGRTLVFAGRGCHDHQLGTVPVGEVVGRWLRGRVLFEGRAVAFHVIKPLDHGRPDAVQWIDAAGGACVDGAATDVAADWSPRTAWRLRYPASLRLGDWLALDRPRVLDASPVFVRVQYDATAGPDRGAAVCEIVYPQRLRWPVLGRMIDRSIDRPPQSA